MKEAHDVLSGASTLDAKSSEIIVVIFLQEEMWQSEYLWIFSLIFRSYLIKLFPESYIKSFQT